MPSGEFAMIIAGTGPTVAVFRYLFLYDAGHIHTMADPPIIQSTGYAFRGTVAGNPVTTDDPSIHLFLNANGKGGRHGYRNGQDIDGNSESENRCEQAPAIQR
jgi:hypothetical protein